MTPAEGLQSLHGPLTGQYGAFLVVGEQAAVSLGRGR